MNPILGKLGELLNDKISFIDFIFGRFDNEVFLELFSLKIIFGEKTSKFYYVIKSALCEKNYCCPED